MADKSKKTVPFEKAMERLEELVGSLESGDLSLEQSLGAFEEGIKIVRDCRKYLDETQHRIEILLGEKDGEPEVAPFEAGENE